MYVCMDVCIHVLSQLPRFMGIVAWYIDIYFLYICDALVSHIINLFFYLHVISAYVTAT